MPTVDNQTDSNRRMRVHRARLRQAGLRPVQIWVPDIRLPRLTEEAIRQSLLAVGGADEEASLRFIEDAADTGGPA